MSKIPDTKNWRDRNIDDWNVTTFTEYLKDIHKDMFGVSYVPFGGVWGIEQGFIGSLIGTKSRNNPKKRVASNNAVKRFIDETFNTYTPNKRYPGTSFGFMWKYRGNVWQQIESDERLRKVSEEAVNDTPDFDNIEDWL